MPPTLVLSLYYGLYCGLHCGLHCGLLCPPLLNAQPAPGDLVINEILYAPADSRLEFIELLNLAPVPIDLCSITLADSRDMPVALCEQTVLLPPGELAVVARDTMLLKQTFALPTSLEAGNKLLSPATWPALNNSGDTVVLYANTTIIDALQYTPDWGGNGVSLERIDPNGPAAKFNWGDTTHPQGATPGLENSIYNPDETAPALLLAERTTPNSLTLFWDEPINTNLIDPTQFSVDGQAPADIQPLSAPALKLLFTGALNGAVLQHDGVTDLTGNSAPPRQHPISRLPAHGDLHINEIMFAPLADAFDNQPDQPEYIELINSSDHLLSLRHLALAGATNDEGAADTLQSNRPLPLLPPGGYAVYFAPGQTERDSQTFEAAFPDLQSALPLLLPVAAASLGLRNEGDRIAVVMGDSVLVEDLVYHPDWHHPLLTETRGRALERRRVDASPILPSNWSSAVTFSGGTPGAANSVRQSEPSTTPTGRLVIDPNLFSPDGDGIDDVLSIRVEAEKASQAGGIKVFDLAGRLVRTIVETSLFAQQEIRFWDGVSDTGSMLPVGVYIVVVNLLDVSTGTTQLLKQPVILARRL